MLLILISNRALFPESEVMTEAHRDTLRKGILKIAERLCGVDKMCNGLVAEDIFTVEDYEAVMTLDTESKQATKLVHRLLKGNDGGFYIFQNLLILTKQDALANEVYGGEFCKRIFKFCWYNFFCCVWGLRLLCFVNTLYIKMLLAGRLHNLVKIR